MTWACQLNIGSNSIVYGKPLADILEIDWQETFLSLGYVGLILIIFEGGLSARLDLLKANLVLGMLGAATGVCFPVGLSYLLLYLGLGYGAVETFIIGAALSATSLGTTFAVISSASSTVDLAQTRVGSVLVSAAVIDDVSDLSWQGHVIGNLGQLEGGGDVNLGWLIGRPIVASIAMAIITPIVTKYLFAPIFRRFIEHHFARFDHFSNIILMVLSFKHPEGPFVVLSREEGEKFTNKSPTFVHTFERYLMDVQKYLMEPLFFASIGFAIPFVQLWTGKRIWRGIVYSLLMVFAKFVVGVWVPLWGCWPNRKRQQKSGAGESRIGEENQATIWLSALLLGSAMVARGEIGLLIIEIGYNQTSYVTEEGFITGVWAILLNTIIGPATVGILVKYFGKRIGEGEWGLQRAEMSAQGLERPTPVLQSA
ncbi:hypothetical protein BDV12DRAFT_202557 [Aspergillus spectabilis]